MGGRDRRRARLAHVRDGVEAKLCAGPDGGETFLLMRSAERRRRSARCTSASPGGSRPPGAPRRRLEQARRPLDCGSSSARSAACSAEPARRRALRHRFVEDPARPPGCVSTGRPARWDDWARRSEGCYVLRTNVTDWTPDELWRTYIQLSEAEAAFRIHKSELGIRPVWHQREDRVLAHILVCFLAYVLWKTLEQWQRRAGLGQSPRTILDELNASRAPTSCCRPPTVARSDCAVSCAPTRPGRLARTPRARLPERLRIRSPALERASV